MRKNDLMKAWQMEMVKTRNVIPSCTDLKKMYDDLCHVMARELHEGGEVLLSDLGKLKAIRRSARTCRNPRTGETVHISERLVVKFKGAKNFEKFMN